ncbi:hypothetical protein B484DRAFT_245799 [Ochromonadaceae sp. CCMP2298]|nr:hypothetical protein B484DRAFT_245799 [Ochromonadaceae sp. CCMP2298]
MKFNPCRRQSNDRFLIRLDPSPPAEVQNRVPIHMIHGNTGRTVCTSFSVMRPNSRALRFVCIPALVIFVVLVCLRFSRTQEVAHAYTGGGKGVAVIYAGPTFHEEVTSSLACLLHSSGYEVVAYIENGFQVGGVVLPFTDKRIYQSMSLYGRCVDRWITISDSMEVVKDPKLLVVITFPMLMQHGYFEPSNAPRQLSKYGMKLLAQIRDRQSHTQLVLVCHHGESVELHVQEAEQYVQRSRITWLFLADHVKNRFAEVLQQRRGNESSTFRLGVVYPVVPLPQLFGERRAGEMHGYWEKGLVPAPAPSLALAAAIGGLVPALVPGSLLPGIPGTVLTPPATPATPEDDGRCVRDSRSSLFAAQGSFDGDKRDVAGSARCMAQIQARVDAGTPPTQGDALPPCVSQSSKRLRLDLIGKNAGPKQAHVQGQAGRAEIGALSNLHPEDFYAAMAHSLFLITGSKNDRYFNVSATSTVPAALIAGVPVVTSRAFLQLYPCLKTAPIHVLVNAHDDECDSMHRYTYTLNPNTLIP